MSINDIKQELFSKMGDIHLHYGVPLQFFIACNMANNNCHTVSPAVAACLENSKIVTALTRGIHATCPPELHTWVEKDGYVIDAAMRILIPKGIHRKIFTVEDEQVLTPDEYKQQKCIKSLLTKESLKNLSEAHKMDLYVWMTYFQQRIQQLNTTPQIKEYLTRCLAQNYNAAVITAAANHFNPTKMDANWSDFTKKQYPQSFLFKDNQLKITDNDTICFKSF